jgi:hypothetical protein
MVAWPAGDSPALPHVEVYAALYVKCLYLSIFNQNWNVSTTFGKTIKYQNL